MYIRKLSDNVYISNSSYLKGVNTMFKRKNKQSDAEDCSIIKKVLGIFSIHEKEEGVSEHNEDDDEKPDGYYRAVFELIKFLHTEKKFDTYFDDERRYNRSEFERYWDYDYWDDEDDDWF